MKLQDVKTTATSVALTENDMRSGEWRRNSNKYRCTVAHKGNKTSFNLYMGCGIHRRPTKQDIVEALLLDSMAGRMDFEEFCSNFGYEPYENTTMRIYKGCKKAHEKASRLFNIDEVNELMEEIG